MAMFGRDEQMQPGFVQLTSKISPKALVLLEKRLLFRPGIQKAHQVRFRQDCETGVA